MAGKTNTLTDAVLNLLRNTTATGYSTPHVALFSVAPSDTSAGTELSGDGYARKAVTFSAPADYTPTGRYITNTSQLLFGPASDVWLPIVAVGVMTASTGGTLLYWVPVTSLTIVTDSEMTINAGELIIRED